MVSLESIGFYTLSDKRAYNASETSPLMRCELILTDACNFKCPYCRGIRKDCSGTMLASKVYDIISYWIRDGLQNVRFSGGEPTLYPKLIDLVRYSHLGGIKRIAISTNGSADFYVYENLLRAGVNDFSISLDACCSKFGKQMCGGIDGQWERVVNNIERLSKLTYVTVGVVLNESNKSEAKKIVSFAHSLGVSDIRVISAAQYNQEVDLSVSPDVLEHHPILKYRTSNFKSGLPIRGISENDNSRCPLVLDDMAIAGDFHFPCIIYLREQGNPIGRLGDFSDIRKQRAKWAMNHDCFNDIICRNNCLDVCVAYNNKARKSNA